MFIDVVSGVNSSTAFVLGAVLPVTAKPEGEPALPTPACASLPVDILGAVEKAVPS